MSKKEKTVIYVVDFVNKKLMLKEELSSSNSKKEFEKIEKINSAIDCLYHDLNQKKKAS